MVIEINSERWSSPERRSPADECRPHLPPLLRGTLDNFVVPLLKHPILTLLHPLAVPQVIGYLVLLAPLAKRTRTKNGGHSSPQTCHRRGHHIWSLINLKVAALNPRNSLRY